MLIHTLCLLVIKNFPSIHASIVKSSAPDSKRCVGESCPSHLISHTATQKWCGVHDSIDSLYIWVMPQNQQGFIDESFSNGEHEGSGDDAPFYYCCDTRHSPKVDGGRSVCRIDCRVVGTCLMMLRTKSYEGELCKSGQTCCYYYCCVYLLILYFLNI